MTQAATSPQLLRRVNAEAVLAALRERGAGLDAGAATVTDLMTATGLTRATVISVCEDLIALGWVRELENLRDSGGDYTKGRPARRFAFHCRAGVVVGADLGHRSVTAVVADLLGRPLGRATRPFPTVAAPAADERIEVIDETIRAALAAADVPGPDVLAVTVGVPAPVGRDGTVLVTDDFWKIVGVDARDALRHRHGWHVRMENDANLAVLAERWRGAAQGVGDVVAVLAGERLGAGVVESGRLLHGSRGGFGEMAYLYQVEGVEDPRGIAADTRDRGVAALAGRRKTALRTMCDGDPARLSAQMVFAAAADGDAVAATVVHRVAARLARVIGTLSSLLDPELVIICGAVAESAATMIEDIAGELSAIRGTSTRVVASALGADVVILGAVRHALDHVDRTALVDFGPTDRTAAPVGDGRAASENHAMLHGPSD